MGHHLAVSESLVIGCFCLAEQALLVLLLLALAAREHSLRLCLRTLDLKLALLVVRGERVRCS